MAKAEITSGICGFTATVKTRMEERKCRISVESECGAIQRLGEALQEVDPFQEISFRGKGPQTLKVGAKHCYHTACLPGAGGHHQSHRDQGRPSAASRCRHQAVQVR
jgi:hypothetical protein